MIVPLLALFSVCQALPGRASVNINEIVDLKLEMANRMAVATNKTTMDYGSGFIANMFSYEGATGIGLDSLIRTGDCEMRFNGDTITYVYHIGQAIMATFFRKMIVGEEVGSGYYRALNNSLEYSYTVSYKGTQCNTRLNTLKLSMDNVEAYMVHKSWKSSEDSDFEDMVQKQILPGLNNKLEMKYSEIENNLASIFCQNRGQQLTTQGLDVLRTFLF